MTARLVLPFLAVPLLAACAQALPPLAATAPAADARSAVVAIAPPAEAPAARFGILATAPKAHRWVPVDIVEYRVTLARRTALVGDVATFSEPLTAPIVLPTAAQPDPRTKAVFTKLGAGQFYRATVQAWGNAGGSNAKALERLNEKDATNTADFDFTKNQDLQTELTASAKITFDRVAFSGTGSLTLQQPDEGSYADPADAPAGSVEAGL